MTFDRSIFQIALLLGLAMITGACTRSSAGSQSRSSTGPIAQAAQGTSSALDLTGYQLTFDDEFNSMSISNGAYDGSTWYTHTVQCCMSPSDTNGGLLYPGDAYGYSTPNPFSLIPGGGLNISAGKFVDANHVSQGPLWYSGAISSVDSKGRGFSQQYGYFEMMAQLPVGPGTWPAFWMNSVGTLNGHESPGIGEIDIMEQYGAWPNMYRATVHDWSDPNNSATNFGNAITTVDETNSYHTFGLLWDENMMSFYFDRVLVYQFPTPPEMKQPYYVIANLGIGSGFPTDQTPIPSVMKIKYIRAYQKSAGSVSQPTPAPTPTPVAVATPAPTPASTPVSSSGWTHCANEGGTCSVSGVQTVRFGINGKYVVLNIQGGITCDTAHFGDPLPGVAKSCDVSSTPPPSPAWVHCAQEFQTCSVSGTATVRYGVGSQYVSKSVTGAVGCQDSIFGDPAPGSLKSCDVLIDGAGSGGSVSTPAPTPMPTPIATPTPAPSSGTESWTPCAQEGQVCSFSGLRTVRFGVNGAESTIVASNGVVCSGATFMDPAPGISKSCDISSVIPSGTVWAQCAKQGSVCQLSGAATVRYGINGQYYSKSVSGSVNCLDSVFGDPAPGVLKVCEFLASGSASAPAAAATPAPTPAATPKPTPVATPVPASANTLRIMPLGDSITWGWDDPTGNGYRGPLYNLLTGQGFNVQFLGSVTNGNFPQPNNQGRPGATVSQVQAWVDPGVIASYHPDIVLLLIGGNDMLQGGQNGAYPTNAIGDLNSLIDDVRAQSPGVRIFVATITGLTRYPASTYVPTYNNEITNMVANRMAAGQKISLVDLNSAITTDEMVDGIHPTQAGYAKLANVWYQNLLKYYAP